jgi:MFS family permease
MIGDILGGQGGTMIASYQMAGDFGAVAGPVTAGYLVDAASYGAAFGLAAGVLAVAAVLGLLAPETRPRHPARPAAERPRPGGASQHEEDLVARRPRPR